MGARATEPQGSSRVAADAGQPADTTALVDVAALLGAYFSERPSAAVAAERVTFGTSGHRGCSFDRTFNERHVLAITTAIVEYRTQHDIHGPLFLGADTHALSAPARETALEVLAAHDVPVRLAPDDGFTPTPAVSHAILAHNRDGAHGLADGIIVTPSHNPPDQGGFKYNPPHGGPAESAVTSWIETRANEWLDRAESRVRRVPIERAVRAATTASFDFRTAYVDDLADVVDLEAIRVSGLDIGVDPLGGAGIAYWPLIAERYGLRLTIVNKTVDPTFRFMTLDHDGRIRMDPSSPWAMRRLVALKDRFDLAVACDPDHDRHGIVTRSAGLLPPNHYLSAAAFYLFRRRPDWPTGANLGKTVVTTDMMSHVAADAGRHVVDVPVGFKWFVDGLHSGSLAMAGEESAGATILRRNGRVWTTEKDGIVMALLAAEMTARSGRDPGDLYRGLERTFGELFFDRVDAPATRAERRRLAALTARDLSMHTVAGGPVRHILTDAPGNGAPIGGVKIITDHGWLVVRPSGTEDLTKIYAESRLSQEHVAALLEAGQAI